MTEPNQTVIPAGTNVVRVKSKRTFKKEVIALIAAGVNERDIKYEFLVEFNVMPTDKIKDMQDQNEDNSFLNAIVHKAHVEFVDDDDVPYPATEQRDRLFNDPCFSAAIIAKYISETVEKNARKKS